MAGAIVEGGEVGRVEVGDGGDGLPLNRALGDGFNGRKG
jgi:hypothetical protein